MPEVKDLKKETLVIMFMDLHNFSLAMNKQPGIEHVFLQDMYEKLGDIITASGGEIIKYLGDSILCLFDTGEEEAAVNCALGLRPAFKRLAADHAILDEVELEIGLSAGEVITGIFGHTSLKMKDVFGEHVMRAAVIGHHRGIAITEPVHLAVKDRFETKPLPDRELKWLEEPLKVWEIVK